MGYDGELKFDTRVDESGFNSGINKLGTIAKGGLAILGSAVASFMVITKSAVDEIASLEQNIGGIETLFGTAGDSLSEYADKVGKSVSEINDEYHVLMQAEKMALENANKAYQTAGLSANEYMSTVTSFAASLKQSVSDEVEAAKAADQAVIDMADNANKMGTSMELIQNAYQGFAKQNYTMLDNLKLGYGGTKEEMERLLADATALTGIEYDINNLADVYSAIHEIQTELGITGTTAEEAATTIEGSMNSAKAAWSNFLAGVGTPEELASAIDTAAGVLVENVKEFAPRLAETIPAVAGELVPTILELGPVLAETGLSILSDFVSGIYEKAPDVIESGSQMLANFLIGIGERLPELVPKAVEMIALLAGTLVDNLPTIINAGVSLLQGLITGIVNSLPILIAEGPRIINDFCDAIFSAIGNVIKLGLDLIVSLVKGLWDNRGLIIENAGEIFMMFLNIFSLSKLFSLGKSLTTNLANGIKNLGSNIADAGKNLLKNLVNGIKSLANDPNRAIGEIITKVFNTLSNTDWASIGSNIISGIVNGLKAGISSIISAAESVASNALDAAKDALGIHSPSTVFRDQIGKNMALGVGVGFDKNIPVDDMTDTLSNSVQTMQKKVSAITQNSGENIAGRVNTLYGSGSSSELTEAEEINVHVTNVFEVDSTPLVEKTTKATIKKLNDNQKDNNKVKGQ